MLSVAVPGDLDQDGVLDLAVGAAFDDVLGTDAGSVWVLLLQGDGTVKSHVKLDNTGPPLQGMLGGSDFFGNAAAAVGDLNCDEVPDLVVGAPEDDDGGTNRGALYLIHLAGTPPPPPDPLGLSGDVAQISVAAGGVQTLSFDAGPCYRDDFYLVLGSLSGISPGIPIAPFHLPLALDLSLIHI